MDRLRHDGRQLDPAVLRVDADEVVLRDTERAGGVRMDLDPAAPGGFRERVRDLLSPGPVDGAAVVEVGGRVEEQGQRVGRWVLSVGGSGLRAEC
jgi:hypothetical protein